MSHTLKMAGQGYAVVRNVLWTEAAQTICGFIVLVIKAQTGKGVRVPQAIA